MELNKSHQNRVFVLPYIIALFLLFCTAEVLILLVCPPLEWNVGVHGFLLNRLVLVKVGFITTGACSLFWVMPMLVQPIARRLGSALLAGASTWIFLGYVLWQVLANGNPGTLPKSIEDLTLVFGNGKDLLIEPVFVPGVAVLSGTSYYFSSWLSSHLAQAKN